MTTDYPHPVLAAIMTIIYPSGQWSLKDSEIITLPGDDRMPTDEQLAAAFAACIATQDAIATRSAIRTALRAKWDALPAWIRGPFQDKFAAANTLLDAGQDDAAEAIIQYAEVPTAYSVEQAAIFAAVRTELLAALSDLPAVT